MKRSIIGAAIAASLLLAPLAYAQTASVPIGDPYADTLQLWSEISSALSNLANGFAALFNGREFATNSTPPSSQQESASLATAVESFESTSTSATSSPTTTNQTSDQTTLSQNVTSAQSSSADVASTNPAPSATLPTASSQYLIAATPAPDYVTQDELTAQLDQLSNALTAKFTATTAPALPQSVAADGNAEYPYAAENAINNLSNVTITSPSFSGVTTSNIPEGSNLYFTDARVDQELEATSSLGSLFAAPNLTTVSTGLTGFLQATAGVLSTALVNLTTNVTGVLPVANGGTGWSNLAGGFIPFGNGSSAIATSTGLFWNNATGNLGVGTSSPYTQLTVPGYANPIEVAATSIGLSSPVSVFLTQDNYAYVTDSGKFVIYDISNPALPTEIASVSAPGSPQQIAVQGKYAYVTNASSGGGLSIFDISDHANPVLIKTVTGGLNQTEYVYVQGNYAYITSYDNNSLVVYDISNPASPQEVGSVKFTSASNGITTLDVQGSYAYVANQSTTAGIIDISDPSNPVVVSTFTTGSHPNGVHVEGRYLYIADFFGSGIQVWDVSNPANPVLISTMSAGLTNANDFTVQGHYLYAANSYTLANSHLVVFDISNPAYPLEVGSVSTGLNNPQTVRVLGHYAYAVSQSNASLVIFDLGGGYIQQLETGGLETGTLSVRNNLQALDGTFAGGLTVGNNLKVSGSFGLTASSFNATTTASQNYSIFSLNTASSSVPIMTALYNGDVGVGTLAAGTANSLCYNTSAISGMDTLSTCSSDERLKQNVTSLDGSTTLAQLMQLNPVSFDWNPEFASGTPEQFGLIAQQVQQIWPNLVSTTSPTTLTLDGTLSLNFNGLYGPIIKSIQDVVSIGDEFEQNLIAWLGNAQNGIGQLFANEIDTQKLCVGSTCVTPTQFEAMVAAANVSQSSGEGSGGSSSDDAQATDTPPQIQINGDNPAIVQVGDTYNDLGATITGPEADLNLGVTTYVDGTEMTPVQIDTSAAATDTIDYVAIDQNGLTSTSTRIVIIEAPSIIPTDAASTTVATTTDATTAEATTTAQ